jgi:Domain of unknown function (DUF4388)
MGLNGDLDTILLASIFQLLHGDRKTGALQVRNGEQWVNVILREGTIIYAMSSDPRFRLGSMLQEKRIITDSQLKTCLDEGEATKQALGKVLVGRGLLSKELLEQFIRLQVEEILYSLFIWETGEFEYKDAMLNLTSMVVTHLDIMEVVFEASRRIDEMSILKKQIPETNIILRKASGLSSNEEVKLEIVEQNLINLIDGIRTVEQLLQQSGLDKLIVYKILHSLLSSGLIEKTTVSV